MAGSLDWLSHDRLQEMLRRWEGIQSRLESGRPIPEADLLWLSHHFGKFLFARVADAIEQAADGELDAQGAVRALLGSGGRGNTRRNVRLPRSSPLPRTP